MKKRLISVLLILCIKLTLLPATAFAAHPNNPKPKDGWYYLRCMGNYLNLDANGNAELRDKTNAPEGNAKFRLQYHGDGGNGGVYSMETEDGRHLGVEGLWDGVRVKASASALGDPLQKWQLCGENKASKDICSLRPFENKDMVLNASGKQKADGTPIILWTHVDKHTCPAYPVPDGPENSEFRFIPADAPAGETATGTPKTPADGWYSLRFDVNEAYSILDVIRADLVELNAWNCAMPWTRAFYVENKGNNQITLRIADGRYLGVGTTAVSDYGWKVAAVKSPFLWNTYSESLGVANSHRKYSLRPVSDSGLVLRAYTGFYSLGDPITVFYTMGDYGRSEVVFWELSGDEIPEAAGWTLAPVTPPAPMVTAAPSKTSFVMSSRPVSVTAAYTINSTNYLQLRAIAIMLNGTAAQFDVGWDGQYAVIEPGKSYSGAVTETKLQNTTNVRKSETKFKMNGEVFKFSDARLIEGDTNYLQLREFAQKLSGTASQFNVYWDDTAGKAIIQPGVAYTGSAS